MTVIFVVDATGKVDEPEGREVVAPGIRAGRRSRPSGNGGSSRDSRAASASAARCACRSASRRAEAGTVMTCTPAAPEPAPSIASSPARLVGVPAACRPAPSPSPLLLGAAASCRRRRRTEKKEKTEKWIDPQIDPTLAEAYAVPKGDVAEIWDNPVFKRQFVGGLRRELGRRAEGQPRRGQGPREDPSDDGERPRGAPRRR